MNKKITVYLRRLWLLAISIAFLLTSDNAKNLPFVLLPVSGILLVLGMTLYEGMNKEDL